jgi:hypothetical protein
MKKSLLLFAAAAPLLVACGAGSVSQSDVESKTKDQLSSTLGDSVEKVECPEDLKAEKGESMTCTATVAGEELDFKIEVTKVDGDSAEWSIEPAAE